MDMLGRDNGPPGSWGGAHEPEEIATLDRRGFSIYKTPGGAALRLVLD